MLFYLNETILAVIAIFLLVILIACLITWTLKNDEKRIDEMFAMEKTILKLRRCAELKL